MHYGNIQIGVFIKRLTRFTAEVKINGLAELCHIKNTGRLKELLIPGAEVYLAQAENRSRSTKYDLVAVRKGKRLINIDSSSPNRAVGEFLQQGGLLHNGLHDDIIHIKPEVHYEGSRFDFYIESNSQKAFVEVKGVTLEKNGIAMFPDAPTERGIKHLMELAQSKSDGYEAYIIFVIQMEGVSQFTPNRKTHPEFATALADAIAAGVNVLAFDCVVTADSIVINKQVPIKL